VAERAELVALVDSPGMFLDHDDPVLRRMATTALDAEACSQHFETLLTLLADREASVRAAAAEKLGGCGNRSLDALIVASTDEEAKVREAVATALGEVGNAGAIEWLIDAGRNDSDRTVKEAAVAALGAVGDDSALDALIEFVSSGPPQVRRRAIAAITVFDDESVEPAIRRAALDRNPGVREAAEMVVGKQLTPS